MPRPDVSEERTNQVLEAAMRVFARLGFSKARMDDIADEAKISKGLLYWYFKSKDAIISALLERFFFFNENELDFLQSSKETVTFRLEWLTHFWGERLRQMTFIMSVAFEFYAIAFRQEKIRKFLRDQYFETFRKLLADLIQQGIDTGEFAPVNTMQVATAIIAIYEGTYLLYALDPDTLDWESQSWVSISILLSGLKPGS